MEYIHDNSMTSSSESLFTEYLRVLGVPHTDAYSTRRFRAYPRHMVLTAMYDLLREYKASPEITEMNPEAASLRRLCVPFVAETADGCRLVTEMSPDSVTVVESRHRRGEIPVGEFLAKWNGRALTAAPTLASGETNYKAHRFKETSWCVEKWVLIAALAFLIVSFAVINHIFSDWSTGVMLLLNGAGIYVCYLLILKDAHVESRAADSVCGVIESHGCSTVLSQDVSVFMGLFPWCQIGMTYFSVSFLALLLYPPCVPYLAVESACCLPYTLWSVGYQKFKAHAWCTLCLCVQTLFWLEFIVYLAGGHFRNVFPLHYDLALLLACYLVTLLAINRLIPRIFGAEMSAADAASAASSATSAPASGNTPAQKPPVTSSTAGIHVNL